MWLVALGLVTALFATWLAAVCWMLPEVGTPMQMGAATLATAVAAALGRWSVMGWRRAVVLARALPLMLRRSGTRRPRGLTASHFVW